MLQDFCFWWGESSVLLTLRHSQATCICRTWEGDVGSRGLWGDDWRGWRWGLPAEHLARCWERVGGWSGSGSRSGSRSRPWGAGHRSMELSPPPVAEVLRANLCFSFLFKDWLFSSSFPRNVAQYPSHKYPTIFIHKLASLVLGCL